MPFKSGIFLRDYKNGLLASGDVILTKESRYHSSKGHSINSQSNVYIEHEGKAKANSDYYQYFKLCAHKRNIDASEEFWISVKDCPHGP